MSTGTPTATRAADPAAARTQRQTVTRTEKGISLARGPALILGTILTAVGLYLLYKAHTFPKFANFPNGHAHQDGTFLFGIFGANGWTAMLTAVAGALLLFGAAQHLLAKTMSLIVGVVLGAGAIIGFTSSGNVLGMAGVNHLSELGWAIVAVILLFNTLVPRRTRTVEAVAAPAAGTAVADDGLAGRRGLPPERARRHEAEGAVAAGAAGAAVAEHEHRKHERERAADDPAAVEGRGEGEHHHLGRDAALAGGAAAVAEHEHRKHERERAADDPGVADRPAGAAAGAGSGAGAEDATVAGEGRGAAGGPAGTEDPTVVRDPARGAAAAGGDPAAGGAPAAGAPAAEDPATQTGTTRRGGLLGRVLGEDRDD